MKDIFDIEAVTNFVPETEFTILDDQLFFLNQSGDTNEREES